MRGSVHRATFITQTWNYVYKLGLAVKPLKNSQTPVFRLMGRTQKWGGYTETVSTRGAAHKESLQML